MFGFEAKGTEHASQHRVPEDINNRDTDLAFAYVGETAHDVDRALERRVVRKIDWFLIPAMIVGYGLVYYDKAILGSASVLGITTDLHLSVTNTSVKPAVTDTSRLSWATSLFYFGMLAGLWPMTLLLQRFNLGRILGGIVILWGIVAMCTAAVMSWEGLYAQRFFLGFVESIIPTGFMCIIASYYTQREQALRQSLWFSATGLWTIIGGAISYGFGTIGNAPLKRWQYLYLMAGALTVVFGICCFALPNSPLEAWFLKREERLAAVERLRKSQTGVRCQKIKMGQIVEALTDVKVWLIFVMMLTAYTINGAVSGFGPLIVSTFGWSSLDAILLQFPLGGICLIMILVSGFLSAKIPNIRIILLILNCLPVIVGCALIWRSTWSYRAAAPVVGYSITGFFGAVVSLIIVLGMSNVAGATKKSAMAAVIFVAYTVGNIIGPQLIKSQTKSRHYPELWLGLIICYCICIVASATLYFVLWSENKRRERLPMDEAERDKFAFMDLTDKENPYFRYVL